MFLKLKINEVTIKCRGYADRRKQRDWLYKEDTSSPTVSTEGLMLFFIIDTMEGREVATAMQKPRGYLWNTRGITTVLVKTFKILRRNGISDK